MAVKHNSYTAEQAEELDRALEAQYEADTKRRNQSSDDEREQWRKVRRASAIRVFEGAEHSE